MHESLTFFKLSSEKQTGCCGVSCCLFYVVTFSVGSGHWVKMQEIKHSDAFEPLIQTSLSANLRLANLGWPVSSFSVGRVSADICRRLMCEFLYSSIWFHKTPFTSFTAARLLGVSGWGRTCPTLGFNDSPPPLGFGTLFLCTVISIGKGGLEFFLRQGY